jgi:hypothetical protein
MGALSRAILHGVIDLADFEHPIAGQKATTSVVTSTSLTEIRSEPDVRIAALAARQHGVVARWQLVELGLSRGALYHRTSTGRLHSIHRGVYAVGHPRLSGHGRWMAAVLACGQGAVLSHRSAGALWDLTQAAAGRADVTVESGGRRVRRGIQLHRARTLPEEQRTKREGVPVTTVARTLLDLAEMVQPRQLVRAFEAAERLGLLDMEQLIAVRDGNRGRRGVKSLSALIDDHHAVHETRSELERRFIDFCHDSDLPMPVMNTAVAGFEVDALWPDRRLVVELDGYSFHRSRRAFEGDRVRDAQLQLAGYRVLRVTSRRLAEEESAVAGTIRKLLRSAYVAPTGA